jgi:hypothetical protein
MKSAMARMWVVATFVIGGCGGGSAVVVELDGQLPDNVAEVQREEVAHEIGMDLTPEMWNEAVWEIGPEVFVECENGCFMDPCEEGEDCQSGLCIDHFTGSVCTQSCIEECPAGWQCEELNIFGSDPVFACASPFTHLCRPCHGDGDCKSASGTEDICVDYGEEGSFCGAPCLELGCPQGYSCQSVTTSGGATADQCVPDSGECFCSPQAIALAASTSCFAKNEFGQCEGIRSCGEEGLSECGADTPAMEECNGIDDNCNGETDEALCDDSDDCTTDSCVPGVGCVNEPLTGTGCDDEDVCTLADHCEAGICTGTPIDCDDDNPCTFDNCDAAGGCLYTYNTQGCDDGNPCTVGDGCSLGDCVGVEVDCDCMQNSDCGALEDGNLCNGTLECDVSTLPHKCAVAPDTTIECEEPTGPDGACLETLCNPQNGECSWVPTNQGGACSDGNVCTLNDQCAEGLCVGGAEANCNDGNPCTDDACDPVAGCLHEANQAPCEDGDVCTVSDLCAAGTCIGGEPLVCDDNNLCTDDQCDPGVGCLHANNTLPCNDGSECTTGDLCAGGQCQGSGILDCNDGNFCTDDGCDGALGCVNTNNTIPCNDGDACTTGEVCGAGICQGGMTLNCNDGNPCTDDSCHPQAGCEHSPNIAPCNDGDVCTTTDICADTICVGSGELACDDTNPCTADSCDAQQGCLSLPVDGECDDGNACTPIDTCANGFCAGSGLLDCNDQDPCTNDWCDPSSGCVNKFNSAPCNDNDLCTTVDTCVLGECQGSAPLECDDGNVCTDDSCDPDSGCTHGPGDGECDDQNPCTANDQCTGGICKGLGLTDCNDDNVCTDDLCDPQVGCIHQANSTLCEDGNVCTEGDQCAAGVCGSGAPINCNDSNDCTDDTCDIALGCQHIDNDAQCDDGNPCTSNDACAGGKCLATELTDCDDQNLCTDDSCDPLTGCIHDVNTVPCDDGDACTVTDACAGGQCAGSGALDCDDSNACTTDTCDAELGCIQTPIVPCCGDGSTDDPEECDDSNVVSGDGCSATCTIELQSSCKTLLALKPGLPSGTYEIDANDDDVAESVYCNMTTDGGGYTMVRYDDNSLAGNQTTYMNWCAARGMEIIVPRTKAHALAIVAWNNGTPPNLVNVYPKYNGANGLSNWIGKCKGVNCSFWMSDSNSCGCTNHEPNGDNNTAYTIYRRTTGCDFGNWNDAGNRVDITGSVICSTNDK